MKLFYSFRTLSGVAILFSILLIAGCGGDDPKPDHPIVGTWNVTGAHAEITPSTAALIAYLVTQGFKEADAQEFLSEIEDNGNAGASGTIEFKNDGSYVTLDGADRDTGTWEVSSDGKILLIDKGTSQEQTATIAKLDDKDLEIDLDLSDSLFFPASAGIGYHVVLVLKRV